MKLSDVFMMITISLGLAHSAAFIVFGEILIPAVLLIVLFFVMCLIAIYFEEKGVLPK